MFDYYPHTGAPQMARPLDIPPERSYNFLCRCCGHRFSVLHRHLRNFNLPDDTPCPKCGSSYCHREAGPILSHPTDD
jgi:hypothetical protein